MTREIYEAMKRRISIKPLDDEAKEYYKLQGWPVPEKATFYFFNAEGLNEGVEDTEEEVYSIRHGMTTRNMWNVCQRFYSFIQHYPNINERLLWKHDA